MILEPQSRSCKFSRNDWTHLYGREAWPIGPLKAKVQDGR